jgi:hypothetical protein
VSVQRDPALVAVGVDLAAVVDDELRTLEQRAQRYWTAEPPIEEAEVLVMGTVVVVEIVRPDA